MKMNYYRFSSYMELPLKILMNRLLVTVENSKHTGSSAPMRGHRQQEGGSVMISSAIIGGDTLIDLDRVPECVKLTGQTYII